MQTTATQTASRPRKQTPRRISANTENMRLPPRRNAGRELIIREVRALVRGARVRDSRERRRLADADDDMGQALRVFTLLIDDHEFVVADIAGAGLPVERALA